MSNRRKASAAPVVQRSTGQFIREPVSLEDVVTRRLAEANANTMDVLLGATDEGDPAAFPASAGEFAARWNRWPPERRENFVRRMIETSQIAMRCLEQHDAG